MRYISFVWYWPQNYFNKLSTKLVAKIVWLSESLRILTRPMKFWPFLKSQASLSCFTIIVFVMLSLSVLSLFATSSSHVFVDMIASLLRKIMSLKWLGHSKVFTSLVLFVSTKQLFNCSIIIGVAVLRISLVSSRFDIMSKIEKFGHRLAIYSS